jgi:hypothetical protein
LQPRTARRVACGAVLGVAVTCTAIPTAIAQPAPEAPAGTPDLRAAAPVAPLPSAAAAAAPAPVATIARAPRIKVLHRRLDLRAGSRATVSGRVSPRTADVRVRLQVERHGRWRTIDGARTSSTGRYTLRERLRSTQSLPARVAVSAAPGLRSGRRSLGRINVYRVAYASWYGPGLYGNHLSCGGRLSTTQLGVAHKTLPCGTRVTLRHGGRSIRVPVIDRGPFVAGREYDLTAATARAIGFTGHGAILATQ